MHSRHCSYTEIPHACYIGLVVKMYLYANSRNVILYVFVLFNIQDKSHSRLRTRCECFSKVVWIVVESVALTQVGELRQEISDVARLLSVVTPANNNRPL